MKRVILGLILIVAACGGGDGATTGPTGPAAVVPPQEIVLVTHDSFAITPEVLARFEEQTGVGVRLLMAGDAGTMVTSAILSKDNPTADVMFGIDNTFLARGLEEGLFLPYESSLLESVPDELVLDDENRVTPIDFANVCINFDKAGLASAGLPAPQSLMDLVDPAYRGTLVVQDPGTSSPGFAFLLSTIAAFPEDSPYPWQEFWSDLAANEVLVVSGWEEAYTGVFSGGSVDGDRPLVVSYASSPPVGVLFSEEEPAEAPTGVVLDGCFRQIEFAGILSGTRYADLAGDLIDFMLSVEFQEDIPLNMFVYPANAEAALPEIFVEYTSVPESPNTMEPSDIEANRAEWIETWTDLMR